MKFIKFFKNIKILVVIGICIVCGLMLYRAMPSVERYDYSPSEYVIRINAKNFPISEEENTLLNSSYGTLTLAFAKESCKNKKKFCEIASFMKETNIDSTQFKIFKNGFLNQGKI